MWSASGRDDISIISAWCAGKLASRGGAVIGLKMDGKSEPCETTNCGRYVGSWTGSIQKACRGISSLQAQMVTGAWSEGPYASEGDSFDHSCDCLVGRVIGIYAPSFEEPSRG
ncbi:hypothetical protein [Brucella cytisi]|uniref:hypothetical protein n=1 Tax=Brucella cytisi TaxID=407152 RepID=UPI0011600DD4|nr:hypothetical protein [Brucella cytisi]